MTADVIDLTKQRACRIDDYSRQMLSMALTLQAQLSFLGKAVAPEVDVFADALRAFIGLFDDDLVCSIVNEFMSPL